MEPNPLSDAKQRGRPRRSAIQDQESRSRDAIAEALLWMKSVQSLVSGSAAPADAYSCSGKPYFKFVAINGILMWPYLPLIFVLFGLHVYVSTVMHLFCIVGVLATATSLSTWLYQLAGKRTWARWSTQRL